MTNKEIGKILKSKADNTVLVNALFELSKIVNGINERLDVLENDTWLKKVKKRLRFLRF